MLIGAVPRWELGGFGGTCGGAWRHVLSHLLPPGWSILETRTVRSTLPAVRRAARTHRHDLGVPGTPRCRCIERGFPRPSAPSSVCDQQRADRMTDSTPHALAPWAPGTAGIRTAHRGPVRGGDVVGSSQIVLAGTIPQENPVFVRASAKLRESHSTKGRTHEAEDLLRAIGQSETEIRCS
jgi:hypothetical protein